MLVSVVLVSLFLGNAAERGTNPSAIEQRTATRVRLITGGGVTFAAGPAVSMIAPSFHFEVGAMLNDRFAIGGMLQLGTLFFGASTLMIGANATWVTTEWLTLGAGVAAAHLGATGWEEYAAGQALLVPMQADVMLPLRGTRAVKRRGLALTVLLAPGLIRVSNSGFRRVTEGAVAFQFLASVGLAYALW
jgi:hypothetical protein